jgi:hypothetical protein
MIAADVKTTCATNTDATARDMRIAMKVILL